MINSNSNYSSYLKWYYGYEDKLIIFQDTHSPRDSKQTSYFKTENIFIKIVYFGLA